MKKNCLYIGLFLILILSLIYVAKIGKSKITKNSEQKITAYDADSERYQWDIQTIATGLEVPWDFALDKDGNLFITERHGELKVLEKNGRVKTISVLPQVVSVGESGLTGMALHPNFSQNNLIFLYYTYRKSGEILNRVSRFTFKNNALQDENIILDNIPGGSIHNGGRLRFGPDEKLWILTGDGARPMLAQDMNSLGGKVLRLNGDGSIPSDNPIKNSPVFSLGHRNPQGLAWHPLTEELLITEHGETAHDEINLIKADGNFGWPVVKKCYSDDPKYISPIICSGNETYAPSGIASFGTNIWRLRNSFVFAGLRGNLLERFEMINSEVKERETIIKGDYGRLRAILTDKDGNIYVGTSNKDGRGSPSQDDDRILKITPKLLGTVLE